MARSSRVKRRGSVRSARKSRSSTGWYALSAVILVLGIGLIVISRPDDLDAAPKVNVDHWHAAIGYNVCGTDMGNQPEFEAAEGLHSHGDGLMHLHPFLTRAAGKKTTVGLYFELGGIKASEDSFTLWHGESHKTGDNCGDKKGEVRWAVNGKEQKGSITGYRPQDGDAITLALLPKGDEIPAPPSASELAAPQDLNPNSLPPESSIITIPPDATVTTVAGDAAATTIAGDTTATTTGETPASSTP